jgi:hypothetical protein
MNVYALQGMSVAPLCRAGPLLLFCSAHSPAVQRIDDHLAVDGARDLDAAVAQAGRRRSAAPGAVGANVGRLGEEVGQGAGVELRLAQHAVVEQLVAALVEGAVQQREELACLGRENLLLLRLDAAWTRGKGRELGVRCERLREARLRDDAPVMRTPSTCDMLGEWRRVRMCVCVRGVKDSYGRGQLTWGECECECARGGVRWRWW